MFQSLAKYLSTKNQIICILFFTYIYDLVRAGFIESRRKQLEAANRNNERSGSPPVAVVTSSFTSRRSKSDRLGRVAYRHNVNPTQPVNSPDTLCTPPNSISLSQQNQRTSPCRANFLASYGRVNLPRNSISWSPTQFQIHSQPRRFPTQHKDSILFETIFRSAALSHTLPLASSVSLGSLEQFRPLETRSSLATCLTARDEHLFEGTIPHENGNSHFNDECPLEEMHWLVRRYQYLSHFLVTLSFIKYTLLLIFDNELFGTKRTYSCYLPGRTAILPQLSPVFSFMVLSYHAMYRLYLCVLRKTFHLDCFIFLMYDRKTIESKQANELARLRKCQNSLEANRLYAMNMFFFTKVYLRDKHKRTIYRVKSNRNVEHWIKIKKFCNRFVLFALGNIALWSIPLSIVIVLTVLSVENFSILYESCDLIVRERKSNWSLLDLRQSLWFLCDMIDSGWLLFDTSQALVWPFTSMVFCAQDLNITIDKLNEITKNIAIRLKLALNIANDECFPQQIVAFKNRRMKRLLKSFEVEILIVQSEITQMLQQISQVDEFMNKISAFCIFCWICSNLMVQIVSLNRNKLVILDTVIQFMQICGLLGLTFTFAYIAQVNTKTRQLYVTISNLIALDPNPKTKESWLLVLEYFNKMRPSYSLRLGPFTELTLANYIKACSWLITGALIMVSLFKFKKDIHD